MDHELAFGLQSDLFDVELSENEVQAAQKAGFNFFEIWAMEPHFSLKHAGEAVRTRRLLDKFGMSVKSVHAPIDKGWDISSADETVRKESVRRTKLSAQRLVALGGDVLVVHPGRGREPGENISVRMSQSERSVTEMCEFARKLGLKLALENLCPNEVFDDPEDLRSMIDRFDQDVVGVCFDSSHANILRNAVDTARTFQGRVVSVHLSDNRGSGDDHLPPFEGNIDWERVLGTLIEGGFRGPWLFEVLGWGADPYDLLRRAAHGLEKMRPIIAKLLQA